MPKNDGDKLPVVVETGDDPALKVLDGNRDRVALVIDVNHPEVIREINT